MTIREMLYQSDISWVGNKQAFIDDFNEHWKDDDVITKEEWLKYLLSFNDKLSDLKEIAINEVIKQIDDIDITLLNHKVPKNKLKL